MIRVLSLAAAAVLAAGTALADPIEGIWQTQADDGAFAMVRSEPCGAAFCGTITRTFKGGTEYESPNKGKQIVRAMVPQGGGAYHSARRWIEASTGLVVGEDYEAISANWQTGFQAFLDGSVEMYVNGCLDPCQQFLQFSETESLRFIQPEMTEGPEVEAFLGEYSFLEEIPAGIYEKQTNDGPVISHNTSVGIAISADLDEELVYQITRAFWENLDQVTSQAPWAAALDVNFAAEQRGLMQLHPGARRYYEEVGAL